MAFKEHCRKIGIDVNQEDFCFIKRALEKTPYNKKRQLLDKYCEEWVVGMADNDNLTRQNKGRRRANLYLLDIIYL